MPDFSPFAGLRYDCDAAGADLDALAAPPYDVIDDDQRAALEAADAHNSVRLILPRDERTRGRPLRSARPTTFDALAQQRACCVADPAPRFYAYRMEFTDPHGAPPPHPRRHRRARAARARRPTTCSPTSARCRRRSPTGSRCSGRRGRTSTRSGA